MKRNALRGSRALEALHIQQELLDGSGDSFGFAE
jgi:hypothetical protein